SHWFSRDDRSNLVNERGLEPTPNPICIEVFVLARQSRIALKEKIGMAKDGITRRHFFIGSLLAGAIPAAGWGSVPSLKMLGYKSPNEKLNIAGIGAGGKPGPILEASRAKTSWRSPIRIPCG